MPYMATSDPPADGTPPAVRSTVDTLEELAGVFLTLPGVTQARYVDPPGGEHPEYGEGVFRTRLRGRDVERPEPQLYLGGRPLEPDEEDRLDALRQELRQALDRFGVDPHALTLRVGGAR